MPRPGATAEIRIGRIGDNAPWYGLPTVHDAAGLPETFRVHVSPVAAMTVVDVEDVTRNGSKSPIAAPPIVEDTSTRRIVPEKKLAVPSNAEPISTVEALVKYADVVDATVAPSCVHDVGSIGESGDV
jgi:hypothetical protein